MNWLNYTRRGGILIWIGRMESLHPQQCPAIENCAKPPPLRDPDDGLAQMAELLESKQLFGEESAKLAVKINLHSAQRVATTTRMEQEQHG